MMLSAMLMMMRWITPVDAAYNRITLKFKDDDDGVEYDALRKVVKASSHISSCIRFNEVKTAIIGKNTVKIDCSSHVFTMIDRMLDEENTTEWEEIAREFNLNMICEILGVSDYLLYDDDVRDVLHKRLVEHIFPRIVFSVTNEEQRGAYMKSNKEDIKRKIADQMGLILPLYLQRYNLGVRKEADMAVIYKDAENKNQKEVLKSIEFSELRILPEALDSVIREEVNTDENQRLGVLLWMFDVYYFGISTLDLSGHTLTDGLMGQLSAMEHLKTLDLRECSMELGNDCDWIGTGFKVLEDLDISGVKINENVACILSKIESLKRLNLRGCLVELGDNCDWIGAGFKALEDIDISGEKIDRNMVCFLSKFENLRRLNLRRCLVELGDNCDWTSIGFKALEDLDISGVKIDDNVACILSKCENLRRLNLRECLMNLGKDYDWKGNRFRLLEDLDISGVKLEDGFAGILCGTTSLKKLNMEKCFIKLESSLEFIREQKDLKELRIGRNYLSEEHLDIIFSHENIEVLDMDSCAVDDMYVYGEKIESTEMLKVFNGRKMVIKEEEMRIILLETDDEYCLENWKMYNERLMFFGDDGEIEIKPLTNEIDETDSDALESGTKTWRLSELNGSQVFIDGDREIRIILPQTSSILEELNESMLGEIYFTGKENGKMNFLDVMKGKGFMKRVKEYNCGQVYFGDKHIDMIFSHKGLKKLNMRQCGLESKAIMKITEKSGLMELDLSDNNLIGENDMIHIINECPNLKKLNMNKCRMIVTGDFKEIPTLERLEELNIGGNKLNCDCYKFIFKHDELLKLSIEGCGFIESELKGINKLKKLKELYVNDNFICKGDLDEIFKLENLDVLDMSKNTLIVGKYKRNVNIEGIKALSNLKVLDMSNNSLHIGDIDEIFKLRELRELRIGNCEVVHGMLKDISKLSNLEKLSAKGNEIDENDMKGVTELKELKELNMSGCRIYGNNVFNNIGRLKDSLVVLDVEKSTIFSKESMKKFTELINLQELRLIEHAPFEILCDILESVTCLRVLHLGEVDVEKFVNCEIFPMSRLSKLEVLKLKCAYVSNEFVQRLSKSVNLRELTVESLENFNHGKSSGFNLLVLPTGLRKLKVSGIYYQPLDLYLNSDKDAAAIFESLEELKLRNIGNISEEIVSEIRRCTKLRKFELRMNNLSSLKYDFKGISDIVTLEELVFVSVDLSRKDIVQLSCLKQLRRLKLWSCDLNMNYLNEIGKLKSLEALDIQNNTIPWPMNEILSLKNLRELSADEIYFDYDKQGDFEMVKGFERLKYDKWGIYRNNNFQDFKDINFKAVLETMKKEATINNWKGVTALNGGCIWTESGIFFAVSSKLVFIESLSLYVNDELRMYEREIEILKNCQRIREIALDNYKGRMFLPLPTVINIINANPFLQVVDMSVDKLNIDLANKLLKCENLHTINLRVRNYTGGFIATLLKKPKETALRSVEFYYCNYEEENCKGEVMFLNFNDKGIRERVIKYITEEDADAIIRAREENVCTNVYFYITQF
ncbi:hypothetical protein PAEPH01_0379 [Pancytospora epiphaga]|nr:hypothetical protein PAEPH01_0379 [Pancytospora epiphaga]